MTLQTKMDCIMLNLISTALFLCTVTNELYCPTPPEVKNSYKTIQWTKESYQAFLYRIFDKEKTVYTANLAIHYACHVGALFPQGTTSHTSMCQVTGEWSHVADCEGKKQYTLAPLTG